MIFLFALLNEASHVSLKKQCPDVEVLHAQKSRHIGVQDQIQLPAIFLFSVIVVTVVVFVHNLRSR